jgi:hypothetical protein
MLLFDQLKSGFKVGFLDFAVRQWNSEILWILGTEQGSKIFGEQMLFYSWRHQSHIIVNLYNFGQKVLFLSTHHTPHLPPADLQSQEINKFGPFSIRIGDIFRQFIVIFDTNANFLIYSFEEGRQART